MNTPWAPTALHRVVHDLVHLPHGERTASEFFALLGLPPLMHSNRMLNGDWAVCCHAPAGLSADRISATQEWLWESTARLRASAYLLLAYKALQRLKKPIPEEIAAAVTLILSTGEGTLDRGDP